MGNINFIISKGISMYGKGTVICIHLICIDGVLHNEKTGNDFKGIHRVFG